MTSKCTTNKKSVIYTRPYTTRVLLHPSLSYRIFFREKGKLPFLGGDQKVGIFRIVENGTPDKKILSYYNFMKFKGLDSDVVILIDVDKKDER